MTTHALIPLAESASPNGAGHRRPVHGGQQSSEFAETLAKLWRGKYLIVATATLCVLCGALVLTQITPKFTASARVMIGVPETKVSDIESVTSGIDANSEVVQNESFLLQSRQLLAAVVETLHLEEFPEFNATLRPRDEWWRTLSPRPILDKAKSYLGIGATPPMTVDADLAEDSNRERWVNALASRIEVSKLGRSHVLDVTATSEDPVLAALIANTLVDLYIDRQVGQKVAATQSASTWLNEQILEMRLQVDGAERQVEEYRQQNGFFSGETPTIIAQQITELNSQLILAEAERATIEARLQQAEALLDQPENLDTAPDVLGSPLVQMLKQQQAEVEREVAELATTYGEKHPRMVNARAELADIRKSIGLEVGKVIDSLRNQARAAATRHDTLNRNLERMKTDMGDANVALVELRALEREADARRALFENLLNRSKETEVQENVRQPDATLISHAAVPLTPSFPPKTLLILACVVGGILLGAILALLRDSLDRTFRSAKQIEDTMGLPVLAIVPKLGRQSAPAHHVLLAPESLYSDSIRKLCAEVALNRRNTAAKVIAFVSALPKEGK